MTKRRETGNTITYQVATICNPNRTLSITSYYINNGQRRHHMNDYQRNLANERINRMERNKQREIASQTIKYAIVATLLFVTVTIMAGHAIDRVLDAKGITVKAQSLPQATAQAFEMLPGLRLQGSEPDLQPADSVQPQRATGGVASY